MGLPEETPSRRQRIPLWLKLAFTALLCVQVPTYWRIWGPSNFLYFCDVALFFTAAALWTESPLLASMPAVGILLPQALWVIDFAGTLCGRPVTGMTAYMFDGENNPLFIRAISLFHGWLPFLLGWMVYRLGYDRRALPAWTCVAWGLCLIAFLFFPAPPAPADNPNLPVNINFVFGPSDQAAQTWMPPVAYLFVWAAALLLIFYLPTHFLFRLLCPAAPVSQPPPGTVVP